MNKEIHQMAQRKGKVTKELDIRENFNDIRFRRYFLNCLFGVGVYNPNVKTSLPITKWTYKCHSMLRHSLYNMTLDIIDKHINSTYFSKNILTHKNVYVLISLMVAVARHGFSKRVQHDFEMHWNANHLQYGNSRFMLELKDRFMRIGKLMNCPNSLEIKNLWFYEQNLR